MTAKKLLPVAPPTKHDRQRRRATMQASTVAFAPAAERPSTVAADFLPIDFDSRCRLEQRQLRIQKLKKPAMNERTGSGLSRADEATDLLRNKILDLTLRPGSRIEEPHIQTLLSFGRTPIREGINRLISEGLLEAKEGRGVYVAPLDLTTLVMLFDAYSASERLAAFFCYLDEDTLTSDVQRMQAQQLSAFKAKDYLQVSYWSAAVRTRIAQSSHNNYIYDFCRRMNNQVRRITYFVWTNEATKDAVQPPRTMEDLHESILGALVAKDRDRLVAELDAQVELLRGRTLNILSHSKVPKFTPG